MDVLATLTNEEQFVTRTLEAAELRAHNQLLQFKMEAEARFKTLQDAVEAKSKATASHLESLAKKYELKLEEVAFDFESLAFNKK